jgi:ribosomal protein S18 acetylase RimI-like enzyme
MTVQPPESARIRPYRPDDRDALYDVCVRTGHRGGDARGMYPYPDLLPDIFAGPYAALEPDLAFVLDDGHRAMGYIVGTADTEAFVQAYREAWLPALRARYPEPADPPTTPTERMLDIMHNPERMLVPELAGYPAHLHIDLLPEHQRAGHGRALMDTFLAALRAKGVPAVHLGVAPDNTGARTFYGRLGFTEIPVGDPTVVYLGRPTAAS